MSSELCRWTQVPPARTSAGHRAQDWNVEKWLQAVALRIVVQDDDCTVRLEDQTTGARASAPSHWINCLGFRALHRTDLLQEATRVLKIN
eukprot:4434054-Pyramimonas_sp.AAC.1